MTLREWLARPGNTQQKLAERIGVTQSAISQWLQWLDDPAHPYGVRVSGDRAADIEAGTDGEVPRSTTRPDLFGAKPGKAA